MSKAKYSPLVERPQWERLVEYPLTARSVLREGTKVKVAGQRGGVFTFRHAERHTETGKVVLHFVGGRSGHVMDRAFTPEQVTKVFKS